MAKLDFLKDFYSFQGAYSQDIAFFAPYEWAQLNESYTLH
jgi:hypothetical protein